MFPSAVPVRCSRPLSPSVVPFRCRVFTLCKTAHVHPRKHLPISLRIPLARHMQPYRAVLVPLQQHLVESAVVLNPCRPFSSLLRRYNPYISCLAPAVLAVLHTANHHVQLRTTIPRINMNRSTNIIPQRLQHLKTQAP